MLFKSLDLNKIPSGTTEDDAVKRYVSSFQANLAWETVRPIIETAELSFIQETIGQELYDELDTAYAAYPSSALSATNAAIIRKLQRSAAYFAWHVAIRELLTTTSDIGTKEATDTGNTALIPRQWTYKQALRHSFKKANLFLDQALGFLESNATDYPTWTASEAYSQSHELFFNNSTELGNYVPCGPGRVVFCQLRPYIRQAEKRYILPTLGQEFFDELKAAISARTVTLVQEAALSEIREALAEWMKICAIPNLRVEIVDGLMEPSFDTDGMFEKQRARDETIRSLWVNSTDAGRFFLQKLKTFLLQNSSDYPTFEASDAYTACQPYTGLITGDDDDEYRSVYGFI